MFPMRVRMQVEASQEAPANAGKLTPWIRPRRWLAALGSRQTAAGLLGPLVLWAAPLSVSAAEPVPVERTAIRPPEPICATPGPAAPLGKPVSQPPGTRRMVERLEKIAREKPADTVPYLNAQRVELLRQQLQRTTDVGAAVELRGSLGSELLRSGRNQEALAEFDALEGFVRQNGGALSRNSRASLELQRAVCFLRLGEQENCQVNHTSQSCLLPIQPGGVHTLPRGSRGAIARLDGLLRDYPDDLQLRWLLNIAYMTLGEYPEKVPHRWLISPKCFASGYEIGEFPEVAGPVGLDVDDLAGGSIIEDFDGDGFLDVMVSAWGFAGQLRYFRNNGDGSFTQRTAEAGLLGLVSGLNMMQTDYNNDGHPDVLILRGAWLAEAGKIPNSLLRNNGDGTFADVTEEAGLLSFHPTQTATWFDFDGDGWLDVFIGNESTPGCTHPCELYRNNRDGTFTECAAKMSVDVVAFVKGVTSGDYNNDGRPDLYLSARGRSKILFRNDGPRIDATGATNGWKFTDVTEAAKVPGPLYSFPTWFWDYDNDGWLDLMVSGYLTADVGDIAADYLRLPHKAETPRLYRNNRDGTFSDMTVSAQLDRVLLAMGCNFGDLDNDGWLDFYMGTGDPNLTTLVPNRMFRNAEGRFFQDVTTSSRTGHLQKGHGVSIADLDNDGDQDLHMVMGGAYSGDNFRNALFLNPGHGNHWLKLKLEGVRSNRPAIGARIRVEVETAQGPRSICKTVNTGASFGANPLRQEIGLGQAKSIRFVEVFWPTTGRTQRWEGLEIDRCYRIREDQPQAARVVLTSFKLPNPLAASARHGDHRAPTVIRSGVIAGPARPE